MNPLVSMQNINKRYGKDHVLRNIDLNISRGEIIGLIGPNGAGKTTLLNGTLGLVPVEGSIKVLDLDPIQQRTQLLEKVSFIADTAILPRWIKVSQCLEFMQTVHPNFQPEKANEFLSRTKIQGRQKVSQLSKGMITQLHLALIMAIDSDLLVLDEPTLGLDILYRKNFYTSLLNEYFDEEKTIIISTHQVEEIEHIITRALFIQDGRVVMDHPIEDIDDHYTEIMVSRDKQDLAESHKPIFHTEGLQGINYFYQDTPREQLKSLGPPKTPRLADLFVAKMNQV